jgi:hypothetical protein
MTLEETLIHAVTAYDRRRANRKGYNHYALAQYMSAVDRAIDVHERGQPLRSALHRFFNDRLLDALLNAVGEPPHDPKTEG